MAKGGFNRRVKIEDGRVVDHRPVDHKDALGWHVVHVPKDIPATLNELITAEALRVKDEKLTWDEDWQEKLALKAVGGESDDIEMLKKRIDTLEQRLLKFEGRQA